jgi:hypothetical protein
VEARKAKHQATGAIVARAIETVSSPGGLRGPETETAVALRTAAGAQPETVADAAAVAAAAAALALARRVGSAVVLEPEKAEFRDLVELVARERARVGLPERD